ncbi:MAG: type II secretion system F family protein [Candidatus Diapherotrites archaeon]|nr:type II secretion system F family protein [Candidatus Diapherotrites archaeon]
MNGNISKSIERLYKRICLGLSRTIPLKTRQRVLYQMLTYAGIKGDFDFYIGRKLFLAILLSLISFLLPITVLSGIFLTMFPHELIYPTALLIGIISFCIIAVIYQLMLYYKIDSRANLVDKILPDFLLLVSNNIRAGMVPFFAFRSAAREEFGPLAEEIKIATSKSLGTESFTEALKTLSERIDSENLKQMVPFMIQSLRAGGKIAELLETSAEDMRETQELKKALISGTKMYEMFLLFIVVIMTPLLLSVSVIFLELLSNMQTDIARDTSGSFNLGFLSSSISIQPAFMNIAAYLLIFGNSLFAGAFIGVISRGKAKFGLKYFPAIFLVSAVIFFFARIFLRGLLLASY